MIYAIRCGEAGPTKIGWVRDCSLTSVEQRRQALQTGCPFKLEVVAAVPGGEDVERLLHEGLSEFRTSGEWFALTEFLEGEDVSNEILLSWIDHLCRGWVNRTYEEQVAA